MLQYCFGPGVAKAMMAGKGAGVSLVWHLPEGFIVESIDRTPGQPGLREGDVLRAVGGVTLSGRTEAAAEGILSKQLRDGVAVDVFRPGADAEKGDLVAVPTAPRSTSGAPINPLWIPSVGMGTWSWGNDSWGFGTWGGQLGNAANEGIREAFNAALEWGSFFFDTAPSYGKGHAESSLGRFCSAGRYAVVATKFFPRQRDLELTPALVSVARDAIKRLQLDGPLDLLQFHKPADPPASLEAQADALATAIHAGLTKAVGVCNFSEKELRAVHERLRVAHGIPLSTCQVEFSLLRQLPETSGLLEACRELGVVVLAYSPLGMGRLTGKYDPACGTSWQPRWGRQGDQARPFGASLDAEPMRLSKLLRALRDLAPRYDRTVSQIALNWVLCHGAVAIPGARSRAQAQENAGAMGWRLSPEDVAALSRLGAEGCTSEFQHG